MAKQQVIQVFEYESLFVEEKGRGRLTPAQFDALVQFNQEHDSRFFTVIHRGIKFRQYVGVIQVGKLTIEVLPKADRESFQNADRAQWHNLLFEMLRVCRLIRLEGSSVADLWLRRASLLDLYIEQFLGEVEQLIHRGLVKQYRMRTANRKVLTGRLEFQKHLSQNLIHKERFYVRHQVYDQVHLLHQIIQEALLLIPDVSTNPNLADQVGRLLLSFPEMPRISVSEALFEQVSYNRKTESYRPAISLARLLLLNYSPDIRFGKNSVLAILFDMNELFEEYVFRQLRRAAPPGVTVRRQMARRFWEYKLLRPDIVVEKDGETTVLDTKWKVLRESKPSDADLKQMYAYLHYFGAKRTILLYPEVYDLPPKVGRYHRPEGAEFECQVQFVRVAKDGNLNREIGMEIFGLLDEA